MSCCKYPKADELKKQWEDHKPALLALINEVHKGIKGIVKDRCGSGIAGAKIKVSGREKTITSGKNFIPKCFHDMTNRSYMRARIYHIDNPSGNYSFSMDL